MNNLIVLATVIFSSHMALSRPYVDPVRPFPVPIETLETIKAVDLETINNQMPGGVPEIYSMITFQAISRGCTRAEDFKVKVSLKRFAKGIWGHIINVYRTKEDNCKGYDRWEEYNIKLDNALDSAKPVSVGNPLFITETTAS